MNFLNTNPKVVKQNIDIFREELKVLGTENPSIVAFGRDVYFILTNNNLHDEFNIIPVTHYSHRISKEIYREEVLGSCRNGGFII